MLNGKTVFWRQTIFFYFITLYMKYYLTTIWIVVVKLISENSFLGNKTTLHFFFQHYIFILLHDCFVELLG